MRRSFKDGASIETSLQNNLFFQTAAEYTATG